MTHKMRIVFLLAIFLLQSLAFATDSHLPDAHTAESPHEHMQEHHSPDDGASVDCDSHTHCHGSLPALLMSQSINFSFTSDAVVSDYSVFCPDSPTSTLLRPPTA